MFPFAELQGAKELLYLVCCKKIASRFANWRHHRLWTATPRCVCVTLCSSRLLTVSSAGCFLPWPDHKPCRSTTQGPVRYFHTQRSDHASPPSMGSTPQGWQPGKESLPPALPSAPGGGEGPRPPGRAQHRGQSPRGPGTPPGHGAPEPGSGLARRERAHLAHTPTHRHPLAHTHTHRGASVTHHIHRRAPRRRRRCRPPPPAPRTPLAARRRWRRAAAAPCGGQRRRLACPGRPAEAAAAAQLQSGRAGTRGHMVLPAAPPAARPLRTAPPPGPGLRAPHGPPETGACCLHRPLCLFYPAFCRVCCPPYTSHGAFVNRKEFCSRVMYSNPG